MSLKNTWVEKAIQATMEGSQRELVDYITEDSPILMNLPMRASNKGLQDTYEVLTDVDSVPLQELDAPLTAVDAATRIEQANLQNWAAKMIVGEDKLKVLGYGTDAASYFADKAESVFRETGGRISRTIYYNSLRAFAIANYAKDNTRVIDAAGSNNTNFSVVAVKWVGDQMTGLYDESGWGDGKVFDIKRLYGGELHEDSNGVASYSTRVKLNLGVKLANPRYVTSIVNIDKDADLATISLDDKLSTLIEECRGADVLYMHPTPKRKIGTAFKLDKLQLINADRDVNTLVDAWDGVPIITDYNLDKGTESNVVLS